jgi:hypothetical protein
MCTYSMLMAELPTSKFLPSKYGPQLLMYPNISLRRAGIPIEIIRDVLRFLWVYPLKSEELR